jgi:hypothetical protein
VKKKTKKETCFTTGERPIRKKKNMSTPLLESAKKPWTMQRLIASAHNTAIIALLLSLLLGLFAIWGGVLLFKRTDPIPAIQTSLSLANLQLLELMMMSSSTVNVTVIQSGTFVWTLEGANLPTRVAYELQSIQIGGDVIEFTVFVLTPPTDVVAFTFDSLDNHVFQAIDFQPVINQLPGIPAFNSNGAYLLPLTQGNINRILSLVPGCVYTDSTCILEVADPSDGFLITRNAVTIYGSLNPADLTVQGVIHGANAVGLPFGLSSAWRLVIPTG